MELRKAKISDINEVMQLAVNEYEMELKKSCQLVPYEFKEELSGIVTGLVQSQYTYVAVEEDKVIGFLGFWGPWDGFFGKCKGVFSPLGGSAFTGAERDKVASILLSYAMQIMMNEKITTFAVSRYAHDVEVGNGFVLNGFGIRCSDAIMDLRKPQKIDEFCQINKQCQIEMESQLDKVKLAAQTRVEASIEKITYEELKKEEFAQVVELRKGLTLHLSHAPVFMPTENEFFYHFERREVNRIFAAKDQGKIIGFIEVTSDDGENFITESETMYNICGAYVLPEYRNQKIAQRILAQLVDTLRKDHINLLGVDCETMNPTALRFWAKYFEAYTYSYVRRIDERVIGYNSYIKEFWKKENI